MPAPEAIRRLFRMGRVRRDVRGELDDELDFHFRRTVEELTSAGMDPADAEREARRRFGDLERYRLELEAIDAGRAAMDRRGEWLDILRQNLSFAFRGMRRAPGFTAAVVLTLALGMGANATMFGVVDRLLLSPPHHVVDADAVKHLYVRRWVAFAGREFTGRTFTFPDYTDLQDVGAFEATAAYSGPHSTTLGRGGQAEQVRVVRATQSLFPLLGVRPARGRFFAEDEDALGVPGVAVLSQEFWERRFGRDRDILGRALDIGAGTYTVVGIAPRGFTGAELNPVDIWVPLLTGAEAELGTEWLHSRNWWWCRVVARLAPGATEASAQAEATAVHRTARAADADQEPSYDPEASVLVTPVIAARGPQPGGEVAVARWLGGVSLIVLLIACANVANLLLARAIRWRRELAIRVALGVSRRRLVAQLLTESLVLATLGALAASALARWGGGLVHSALLPDVAFTNAGIGPRLVGFTVVAAVLTAVLAGLLPALQASRPSASDALRSGARTTRHRSRAQAALLMAQGGLSVILLVGAGLFVLSLSRARGLDLGFDPRRVVMVRLHMEDGTGADEQARLYRDARDRAQRLSGVRGAAEAYTLPFWSSISAGLALSGRDSLPRLPSGGPYVNRVRSGYLEVMGIRVVRGRGLSEEDDGEGAPLVAVVNESMAGLYWPDGDALGQCLLVGGRESPCTSVVGVVADHRRQDLVEEAQLLYYVNLPHSMMRTPQVLMVRTDGDPSVLVRRLRAELEGLGSRIRYVEAEPFQDLIDPKLRSWRLGAAMFTVFGLLALVVAGIGLYSLLSFDVAQRQNELGIRAALGATGSGLVTLVLRQALGLVSAGLVLGLVVALWASRFVEPLLFQVSPSDPGVYAAVAAVLLGIAFVAGVLPAWRATRVDPVVALRAE